MATYVSDQELSIYIKKTNQITLNGICSDFNVSVSTARRILVRMEAQGLVHRYRGGAIPAPPKQTKYDMRLEKNAEAKDRIARKAAESVADGSNILLMGGTTIGKMCPYLHDKSIGVITNSLTVVEQLKDAPNIRLVMLGGIYNRDEAMFINNVTSAGYRIIYADSLFISCRALSADVGYMTDNINAIDFYRLYMKNAGRTVVLADSTKFQSSGIAIFASLNEVDCLITDAQLSEEDANVFAEHGVIVTIV